MKTEKKNGKKTERRRLKKGFFFQKSQLFQMFTEKTFVDVCSIFLQTFLLMKFRHNRLLTSHFKTPTHGPFFRVICVEKKIKNPLNFILFCNITRFQPIRNQLIYRIFCFDFFTWVKIEIKKEKLLTLN